MLFILLLHQPFLLLKFKDQPLLFLKLIFQHLTAILECLSLIVLVIKNGLLHFYNDFLVLLQL